MLPGPVGPDIEKAVTCMGAEKNLEKMGIEMQQPVAPVANYIPVKRVGNILYVSGQASFRDGTLVYEGRLGEELDISQGYEAARIAALNILAILRAHLGSLDKVKSVVKLNGYVASAPGFYDQPMVMNGASDLIAEVFGEEIGRHARTAIGQNCLPFNTPVEVEAIVEI